MGMRRVHSCHITASLAAGAPVKKMWHCWQTGTVSVCAEGAEKMIVIIIVISHKALECFGEKLKLLQWPIYILSFWGHKKIGPSHNGNLEIKPYSQICQSYNKGEVARQRGHITGGTTIADGKTNAVDTICYPCTSLVISTLNKYIDCVCI